MFHSLPFLLHFQLPTKFVYVPSPPLIYISFPIDELTCAVFQGATMKYAKHYGLVPCAAGILYDEEHTIVCVAAKEVLALRMKSKSMQIRSTLCNHLHPHMLWCIECQHYLRFFRHSTCIRFEIK